jgi:hypothetical protein
LTGFIGFFGFPTALLRRGEIIGLRIFTATSLRQGYGGQEERKEHREKSCTSGCKAKNSDVDL